MFKKLINWLRGPIITQLKQDLAWNMSLALEWKDASNSLRNELQEKIDSLSLELESLKEEVENYRIESNYLFGQNEVLKEHNAKSKTESARLANSLRGLKIDLMKYKCGQRAWAKHEARMGVKQ